MGGMKQRNCKNSYINLNRHNHLNWNWSLDLNSNDIILKDKINFSFSEILKFAMKSSVQRFRLILLKIRWRQHFFSRHEFFPFFCFDWASQNHVNHSECYASKAPDYEYSNFYTCTINSKKFQNMFQVQIFTTQINCKCFALWIFKKKSQLSFIVEVLNEDTALRLTRKLEQRYWQ